MYTAHIRVNDNTDQIYISGSAMLGDREYILRQFHFHWGSENRLGSEHTVDGHAYAMEVSRFQIGLNEIFQYYVNFIAHETRPAIK